MDSGEGVANFDGITAESVLAHRPLTVYGDLIKTAYLYADVTVETLVAPLKRTCGDHWSPYDLPDDNEGVR